MARDFAQEFYFRMREAATGRLSRDAKRIQEKAKTQKSRPFDKGRDPLTAGQTLDGVLKEFRWEAQLAEADLFNRWAELVGQQNADNSQPETLVGGVLTIRCKSTAWATQLNLAQDDLLSRIRASAPGALVESLTIIGPQAPSWKRGIRSVSNGRGPRDTYG